MCYELEWWNCLQLGYDKRLKLNSKWSTWLFKLHNTSLTLLWKINDKNIFIVRTLFQPVRTLFEPQTTSCFPRLIFSWFSRSISTSEATLYSTILDYLAQRTSSSQTQRKNNIYQLSSMYQCVIYRTFIIYLLCTIYLSFIINFVQGRIKRSACNTWSASWLTEDI
jgi:hypothetical protein